MEDLLIDTREGLAFVTFNRPQARNALTFPMYEGLANLCIAANDDPGIRAIIITGAGEKAFAAGTDISQFTELSTAEQAIAYAQKHGLAYRVEQPHASQRKTISYSDNFKSTRIGQWTH